MERHIIKDAVFTKHPTQEGVFMKHFFSSQENDRLNNLEVRIIPNFMITPHVLSASKLKFLSPAQIRRIIISTFKYYLRQSAAGSSTLSS